MVADATNSNTRGPLQDTEIIEQIDRDVKRTHPDMQFFNGDSSIAESNRVSVYLDIKHNFLKLVVLTSRFSLHQEAMRHILIIFAKLNPGIRYVQGMNEILAPLFYVFKNDPEPNNAVWLMKPLLCPLLLYKSLRLSYTNYIGNMSAVIHDLIYSVTFVHALKLVSSDIRKLSASEHAEADAFFCFVELLSGFRDNFCQKLDNSVVGIRSTISKLSELLKKHDGELWRHLEVTTKVNPQFYAFRWITLLLTQEFNFANCLHIWDTLLSDPEGPQETLLRICCAMLILVRRRLLAGDFTSNLKLLQNYPSTNISHLLYAASKLGGPSAS
ncbi:hypothetical protein ZIOFF_060438 [Zingiber officinale]|uniref:Rab-GAP TBC domain-containing protein n=1 Tax=Zingiber officinale TaxID=94328 RepID=A0A8J5F6J0_ZINOF|nr:hypothetical protein ZIOFF_060438 [Zingiber officinale]